MATRCLWWFRFALLAAVGAGTLLSARPTPRLLLTSEDFARIHREAESAPWAASARDAIVQAAQDWPAAHNKRYGLDRWAPPPDGGQWSAWYICPTHGVALKFNGPGQNNCPIDGKNYTGWPFDQVIYSRRHNESANAARDNGLAYRLTANTDLARAAATVLLAYADVYATYPIHDKDNKSNTASGGRVLSQTLDEANWIIPMAWAYDLIADSGVLSAAQRTHIEQNLLRAAVTVISRNDAKMSNWQSWHNAGIGAVAFALEDAALISKVIDGPSGFRFQMRESVFGDGFWYEGSWGYHFYALSAHCYLAEMAARAGIDLYAETPLRKMFEAPLRFALPDWTLPQFNDSGAISLLNYSQQYEAAYQRYHDPLFASVLAGKSRGRDALFWGAETLPDAERPTLASAVLPDSGNAVLRVKGSDHTLAFKFGPHGGGHGHYDKLNFITYARGGIMAVDPGTQSYAAPTHNTWDKVTVSHNTVVVDETTQSEAAGQLRAFAALPDVSAVRADAGPAYKKAALERTLLLTPEYVLDSFIARATDSAAHRFDLIYHNYGTATASLPLQPYSGFPGGNGYQYLTSGQSTTTSGTWQATFDMNASLDPNFGSIYVNDPSVQATFQYSREQAFSGRYSGRTGYNFTGATGYIVFSIPASRQPAEVPSSLTLMIYGDGSGNKLVLRIYDVTDERFTYSVGPVNWVGWRRIVALDPARWSHYLGDDDGVIDTPVKSVAVELTYVSHAQGALYVDDVSLDYPSGGHILIQDFERLLRSLRLWMLGAPDTTVVLGDGLGPDLLKPVPFAMARRRATETQFVSLLEPFGDAPAVTAFQAISGDTFRVTAADFDDLVSFDAGGTLRFVRRNRGVLLRTGLAGGTSLEDGGQLLLRLSAAVPVQVDYSDDGTRIAVTCNGALPRESRLLAPKATHVSMNDTTVRFLREADYVVVDAAGVGPRRRP